MKITTYLTFLLLAAPSVAWAQSGDELGLGELAGWIKSAATFLFVTAGPWIATIGLGLLLVAGFTGRMEWRSVFVGVVVVALFFMVPTIVNKLRANTESELNSFGQLAVTPDVRRIV